MLDPGKSAKIEKRVPSAEVNQKGINNQLKAAKHLEKAAVFHMAAAKAHEKGQHKKAEKIAVKAMGRHARAMVHLQAYAILKDQLVM